MAYGEPVHHIMQFDPADPGYLYLMTSHQVRPVPWPDQVPGPAEPSCLPGSARIALLLLPLPAGPLTVHLPVKPPPLQGSLVSH